MTTLRITVKDPDGVYDAILDHAKEHSMTQSEVIEKFRLREHFEFLEYYTIEIDENGNVVKN